MSPSLTRSDAFEGGPRTVPILLGTDAHRYALAWFFNGSLENLPLSWIRKLGLRKAPLTLIGSNDIGNRLDVALLPGSTITPG